MNANKFLEKLEAPFDAKDINWRIQRTSDKGGKLTGFAIPYLDARAIIDRLDKTVGQLNWQVTYTPWHSYQDKTGTRPSQLCHINVYCEERHDWVTKTDGAEATDIEPIKGGLSDSFKRAAVRWGIGKYLYGFEGVWVDVDTYGKSHFIKSTEKSRLDKIYKDWIAKSLDSLTAAASRPKQTTDSSCNAKTTNKTEDYSIKSIKLAENASGTNTHLLLVDDAGNTVKAFLKGTNDKLAEGLRLNKVKTEEKESNYGKYNLLVDYKIAA